MAIHPKELTQAVKEEARRLGFGMVGVTTPDPPAHYLDFAAWIAAGKHGEMDYLASDGSLERRANPRLILPQCKSILVLGIAYTPSRSAVAEEGEAARGRVASYASGDDYHEVLPERLRALVNFVEAEVGEPVPNRWYTDTGPILEREHRSAGGAGMDWKERLPD